MATRHACSSGCAYLRRGAPTISRRTRSLAASVSCPRRRSPWTARRSSMVCGSTLRAQRRVTNWRAHCRSLRKRCATGRELCSARSSAGRPAWPVADSVSMSARAKFANVSNGDQTASQSEPAAARANTGAAIARAIAILPGLQEEGGRPAGTLRRGSAGVWKTAASTAEASIRKDYTAWLTCRPCSSRDCDAAVASSTSAAFCWVTSSICVTA